MAQPRLSAEVCARQWAFHRGVWSPPGSLRPSQQTGACPALPSPPARPATGPNAAGSHTPGHLALRGHESRRGGDGGQQKPRWVFRWPRKTEDSRGLTPLAHPAASGGSVPLAPFRARLLSRPPKAQLGSPASTEQRQPRTRRTPQPRVRLRSRFSAAPPPPVGC